MPRPLRSRLHASAFHVFNRGHEKRQLFQQPADYQVFLSLLRAAPRAPDVRLLAYCVLSNHWHLVVMPQSVRALSAYMQWVTGLHGLHVRRSRGGDATGPVYQGRFKSVPIRTDRHLLTALRYVEANPVRANRVARARDWPWSSRSSSPNANAPALADWPWPVPSNWNEMLDLPQPPEQLELVRRALRRSTLSESLEDSEITEDGFDDGTVLGGLS